MVHKRPRYIVGWMPRVKGNSPGKERSRSGSNAARSPGATKGFIKGIVGAGLSSRPELIGFFDFRFFRSDAQRAQETAIVHGHVERLSRHQRLRGRHALRRAVGTLGLGLSTVDESDDRFEI